MTTRGVKRSIRFPRRTKYSSGAETRRYGRQANIFILSKVDQKACQLGPPRRHLEW